MNDLYDSLIKIAQDRRLSGIDRISKLIDLGNKELGLGLGIVSHIVNTVYTVQYSNNAELIDQKFDLGDTYCAITLKLDSGRVLAIQHFAISQYFRHPAYEVFKLEAYIGAPIIVHGEEYGTINFTQPEPRTDVFSETDKLLVKCLSVAIGEILEEQLASV